MIDLSIKQGKDQRKLLSDQIGRIWGWIRDDSFMAQILRIPLLMASLLLGFFLEIGLIKGSNSNLMDLD